MAEKIENMSLGKVVEEVVTNSISIHCLVGKDTNSSSNSDYRHEIEQRQKQLYTELDRRERHYAKQRHTHDAFGSMIRE